MSRQAPPLEQLRFGEQLGRGATCKVWLACLQTDSTQRFAVKAVEKAKIAGQLALTHLYREKAILNSADNAGIVRFFCTLKDEHYLYFVLEHLEGGELLWHMRRAPKWQVPIRSARVCLGGILLALSYLKQMGVLYRDIKPTNIMFTRNGRLKIVDFGHAKCMGMEERSTSLCGTPHFHAPEIVRGEPHGMPAQLWALGVLVVEMMAGRPPFFDRPSSPSLKEQILFASVDLTCLPEEARHLVAGLLERDVSVREASFPLGFESVMLHPWLQELDWVAIEEGQCVPDFDFTRHAEEIVSPLLFAYVLHKRMKWGQMD
ncbi:MAG: hypothetical protein SGPRY_001271 [Prymnesium sp.]